MRITTEPVRPAGLANVTVQSFPFLIKNYAPATKKLILLGRYDRSFAAKFPETKLAFLDKQAFERLLGPCQNIMKRNMDKYEAQMNTAFGHSGSHGGS